MRLDFPSFFRSKLDSAAKMVVVSSSSDPTATRVVLGVEDIRQRYPWDYAELCQRLKAKFPEFKQNKAFHAFCKTVK